MTKEELYKVSDILNDVLSNYLRGSETEEVLSRFEESISKSDMLQEKYNITGIKSRHATGKLKECIDNQTEEGLEQARKQLEENPQECMYARDNYTDDDRKVLCDGCEEECEYAQKEADWLQELHNKLDSLSKEDFDKVWAKYHQKEESVSEDLKEAARRYAALQAGMKDAMTSEYYEEYPYSPNDIEAFKAGANWQKQQFEKNRLKHCDSITNEQAELEQGFIDQHLDKYNRMPGYLDAIEYGMNLQKEQMMKEAVDGIVEYKYSRSGKDLFNVSSRKLLDAANFNLNNGEKVKLLIIKEE